MVTGRAKRCKRRKGRNNTRDSFEDIKMKTSNYNKAGIIKQFTKLTTIEDQ